MSFVGLIPSTSIIFPVEAILEVLHGEPSRHMMSPLRTFDKSFEPLGAGLVVRMYRWSWALSVLTSLKAGRKITYLYLVNRAGASPGEHEPMLTLGTFILNCSADNANERAEKVKDRKEGKTFYLSVGQTRK